MLKVFLGGAALVAAGLIAINLGAEGGAILVLAGLVAIGASTVAGLSASGKKIQRR